MQCYLFALQIFNVEIIWLRETLQKCLADFKTATNERINMCANVSTCLLFVMADDEL